MQALLEQFASDYARQRKAEGRDYSPSQLLELPYARGGGPLAAQWKVRARTFEAFAERVLRPMASGTSAPLRVLDLGAGNAWLSHRVAAEGHCAIALDIRNDSVDGLGAAAPLLGKFPDRIEVLVAPFEAIPLCDASVDLAVFNASLHYATALGSVLEEAARVVRPGGRIAIMDSPFYASEADGLAMVAEKRRLAGRQFGERAASLMGIPFIEFLTRERLDNAAPGLGWQRHRVRYPMGYELRPLRAALTGKRRPSRFDLWTARRP